MFKSTAFPLYLRILSNESIVVRYEPRNLKANEIYNSHLNNSRFLNLTKDSRYEFNGKILECSYYYRKSPEKFEFKVINWTRHKEQCFIATVCYNDLSAPEVIVLQQYRDQVLLKTVIGKILIKLYYFVSPHLANIIKDSEMTKRFVRKNLLDHIVNKIGRFLKTREQL